MVGHGEMRESSAVGCGAKAEGEATGTAALAAMSGPSGEGDGKFNAENSLGASAPRRSRLRSGGAGGNGRGCASKDLGFEADGPGTEEVSTVGADAEDNAASRVAGAKDAALATARWRARRQSAILPVCRAAALLSAAAAAASQWEESSGVDDPETSAKAAVGLRARGANGGGETGTCVVGEARARDVNGG